MRARASTRAAAAASRAFSHARGHLRVSLVLTTDTAKKDCS